MRLESVKEVKAKATEKLSKKLIRPYSASHNTNAPQICPVPALGIHPCGNGKYKLAIHIVAESYKELIQEIVDMANGEVNVQITGNVYPLTYNSPLPSGGHLSTGISISHFQGSRGTLGCFVRRRGQPNQLLILSNNHVLANCNNGRPNDRK